MALYTDERTAHGSCRRWCSALGVLWHLLRTRPPLRGRAHLPRSPTSRCSPRRSARPLAGYGLVVDWHEVWSAPTGASTSGRSAGGGCAVQRLCARVPQRAFCFSRAARAASASGGAARRADRAGGRVRGHAEAPVARAAEPLVVFAGRLIPEKQAPLAVAAFALRGRSAIDGAARRVLRRRPRARGAGARDRRARAAARSRAPRASSTPRGSTRRCAGRCACSRPPAARDTAWSSSRPPRARPPASWSPARTTPPWSWSRRASTAWSPRRAEPEAVADGDRAGARGGDGDAREHRRWFERERASGCRWSHSLRAVLASYAGADSAARVAVERQRARCAPS